MSYLEKSFGIADATKAERAAYHRRAREIDRDCGSLAGIVNMANDYLREMCGREITRADRLELVAIATAYGEREARYNAACERNA